jgi:hypothetical protein
MTSSSQQQSDLIASWTIADLDARVINLAKKVVFEEKQRQEQGNSILGGLTVEEILEKPYDLTARPLSEVVQEIFGDLPDEAWEAVPADGSANVDHYLYGAPKQVDDSR